MLWSKNGLHLTDNYNSALTQLKSQEKRLFKDQKLLKKYKKSITDDVTKG